MTKEERMLHLICTLTVCRDDMGDLQNELPFVRKMKFHANQFLKEEKKNLEQICGTEDVNK